MSKQYYRFFLFAILVLVISSLLATDAGSDFIAASGDSVPRWDYGMIEQWVIIGSAATAGLIGYSLSGLGWALFAFIAFTTAQGYGINNPEMVISSEWRHLTTGVIVLLTVIPFVIEWLAKSTRTVKQWWKEMSESNSNTATRGGMQDM